MFSISISSLKRNIIGTGRKIAVPASFVIGFPVPVRVVEWVVDDSIVYFAQLLEIPLTGPVRQIGISFPIPCNRVLRLFQPDD